MTKSEVLRTISYDTIHIMIKERLFKETIKRAMIVIEERKINTQKGLNWVMFYCMRQIKREYHIGDCFYNLFRKSYS